MESVHHYLCAQIKLAQAKCVYSGAGVWVSSPLVMSIGHVCHPNVFLVKVERKSEIRNQKPPCHENLQAMCIIIYGSHHLITSVPQLTSFVFAFNQQPYTSLVY